jgi:hypothetical protein
MKNLKQRLVMGVVLAGTLTVLAGTAAMAQDYRWRDDRYHGDRRWNHRDYRQNDWNRNHPSVYVAPGYVYYPPPVVYAPPPVHPGFGIHFSF